MLRRGENVTHGAALDDATRVHDDDVVAHLRNDAEVVRDQQDRHPHPLAQLHQQLEDLRLDRHVERGRRLVGDDQLRVACERHRDHHALPHAARELMRVVVEPPSGLRDADELEHLERTRPRGRDRSHGGGCWTLSAIWSPTV